MTLRQMVNKNLKEDIDVSSMIQQLAVNNANTLKQVQADNKTLLALQQQIAAQKKQQAATAQQAAKTSTSNTTASNAVAVNNLANQGSKVTAAGTTGATTD